MHVNSTQEHQPGPAMIDLVRARVHQRLLGIPAWVVLIQLFIGFGWLRAVAEKVLDGSWWTGAAIHDFALGHDPMTLSWYRPFLEVIVLPGAPLIALIVLGCQLVAGLSLVTGRGVRVGLAIGISLNLHFIAAGAVAPSIFYLLAQGAVVLWMAERVRSDATTRHLETAAVIACGLAGLNVPLISTVDPAHVIDDPAMIFVFGGALAALGCVLAAEPKLPEHRAPAELGGPAAQPMRP